MTRTHARNASVSVVAGASVIGCHLWPAPSARTLWLRLTLSVAAWRASYLPRISAVKHLWASAKYCQSLFLLCCLGLVCTVRAQSQEAASAGTVMHSAVEAEAQTPRPSQALFRLEKKVRGTQDATAFTLETRRGAVNGSSSVRLYNAENLLLRGEWLTVQQRKIYQREATPEVSSEPLLGHETAWLNWEKLWVVKPDAAALASLLDANAETVLEETPEVYWLTCRFADTASMHGLVKARVAVRRIDWRIAELTLIVEGTEEMLEYKLTPLTLAERPPLEESPLLAALDAETLAPSVNLPSAAAGLATVAENHGAANNSPTPSAPLNGKSSQPAQATATPAPTVSVPTPAGGVPASSEPVANSLKMLAVGSGLSEKATRQQMPVYPAIARSYRTGGTVTVYLELDEQGAVAKITRVEGPFLLHTAAREAALGWRFKPTVIDGQPVRVSGYLVFQFKP